MELKRVLVAPDSFKESMTAPEAAQAVARGLESVFPEAQADLCPVADGGEGTAEALVSATGGRWIEQAVTGPLGDPIDGRWGWLESQAAAVVEMAEAAGLDRVPANRRDPEHTTTFGVGEMIRGAMDHGASRILVAIGGSATNDGGAGMAQALGFDFGCGSDLMTGGRLAQVRCIDQARADPRLQDIEFEVACDVTNPLTGPNGAAAVYGPQKGATPEQVERLDAGLSHLASLADGVNAAAPGMGAAGGMGFGMVAFCGARLRRGIDLVLDAVGFADRLAGVDLVVTGEGRLDGQSVQGKTCIGVAQAAARAGVPTVALVGGTGPNAERTLEHGLSAYRSICDMGIPVEKAIAEGPVHLEKLAAAAFAQWREKGLR